MNNAWCGFPFFQTLLRTRKRLSELAALEGRQHLWSRNFPNPHLAAPREKASSGGTIAHLCPRTLARPVASVSDYNYTPLAAPFEPFPFACLLAYYSKIY